MSTLSNLPVIMMMIMYIGKLACTHDHDFDEHYQIGPHPWSIAIVIMIGDR